MSEQNQYRAIKNIYFGKSFSLNSKKVPVEPSTAETQTKWVKFDDEPMNWEKYWPSDTVIYGSNLTGESSTDCFNSTGFLPPAKVEGRIKLPEGWKERIVSVGNTKTKYYHDQSTGRDYINYPRRELGKPKNDPKYNVYPWTQFRCRYILVKHRECAWPSSWRCTVIRLTKQQAFKQLKDYRRRILAGEAKFDEIARNSSDCCTAQNGGDLGAFKPNQTSPRFEIVLMSLQIGEISEIFDTVAGWQLMLRTPADAALERSCKAAKMLSRFNEKTKMIKHIKGQQHSFFSKPVKSSTSFNKKDDKSCKAANLQMQSLKSQLDHNIASEVLLSESSEQYLKLLSELKYHHLLQDKLFKNAYEEIKSQCNKHEKTLAKKLTANKLQQQQSLPLLKQLKQNFLDVVCPYAQFEDKLRYLKADFFKTPKAFCSNVLLKYNMKLYRTISEPLQAFIDVELAAQQKNLKRLNGKNNQIEGLILMQDYLTELWYLQDGITKLNNRLESTAKLKSEVHKLLKESKMIEGAN